MQPLGYPFLRSIEESGHGLDLKVSVLLSPSLVVDVFIVYYIFVELGHGLDLKVYVLLSPSLVVDVCILSYIFVESGQGLDLKVYVLLFPSLVVNVCIVSYIFVELGQNPLPLKAKENIGMSILILPWIIYIFYLFNLC